MFRTVILLSAWLLPQMTERGLTQTSLSGRAGVGAGTP